MTDRENLLRAARFERPERLPLHFGIGENCWFHYPQDALQELMAGHPLLFPGFVPSSEPVVPRLVPWRRAGARYVDSWGCEWVTPEDGMTGAVTRHPLADWDALASFEPPDPEQQDGWGIVDWAQREQTLASARLAGRPVQGSLRHGHTFLTLTYLRGYQSLVLDMADDEARLARLVDMVEEFNQAHVRRWLGLGVEWMGYPDDLGMQVGPMVSPDHLGRYLAPVYERLMRPARQAGCVVHMHSDGDIRALVPQLLAAGVEVLNLQDLVNGIDWMAAHLKGRACIDLDIDRQRITRFGAPQDIDRLVRDAVRRLGSREGGLMLRHGLAPGLPLANLAALMDAMERYACHFS